MIKISLIIICSDCKNKRKIKETFCSNCGSTRKTIKKTLFARVQLHAVIGGKVKKSSKGKPIKEFKFGDDYNRDRKKYVYLNRTIDREKDQYYELIKDKQTGEIIRECAEPLNKHQGHGNDKKKSDKD